MAANAKKAPPVHDPPSEMPEAVRAVWEEFVETNELPERIDRAALEAFCTLVARMREARTRVEDEGMVVQDSRGKVVPHPALAVERELAEDVRKWGDRFAPMVRPRRRSGYMVDATTEAVKNADHLADKKQFAGAIAAAKTLAWLIDEAQRDSAAALQRAGRDLIPNYVKACTELQITPASVPAAAAAKDSGGSTGGSKLRVLRSNATGARSG
ncbi:terminase small subunit [Zhihengliuella halotolerans]|uniref:P27 family predicted phage terminase small subunit n=1 Tax=Zhihengliuella halotolerans TaxID=370736 RepID=A0A4Q8ADB8_9MICC|nr:P27 family phage terminase small subunit [Zhihengliuella halotolerans]RZU61751.1 P27 family predicted phage terminase small subunit [Zhihengliuella halotolerans]